MKTQEKDGTANVWNNAAEGWVDFVRTGKDYWRDCLNNPATFRLIGNVKGKIVLDLACGEGYNTRILAHKGAQVTGIDHSSKLIQLAKTQERKEPLGIRYYRMSASRQDGLSNASFDLVTCFMALHDIQNYEKAVTEVSRVLKPRGRFIFSIVHPCFEVMSVNRVKISAAERYFGHVQHLLEWNMKRLNKPFKTVSFHRSLTDYSLVLAKNGFLISKLVEPLPTKEAIRKHASLREVLTRPQSIIFEAVKSQQ